ncbi:MAG: hypothetical protein FIB00_15365 [Chloroflexi bacterium]|nr:hypothetical protein [Chloroflexota bacterium]PWB46709.1 MAG: hypothetical protein C3F10_03720 [Dehalococcoidia bacterium]
MADASGVSACVDPDDERARVSSAAVKSAPARPSNRSPGGGTTTPALATPMPSATPASATRYQPLMG